MVLSWVMMVAVMGQATQPANPPADLRGSTRPGGMRISVSTRPAQPVVTPPVVVQQPIVVSPATRPAVAVPLFNPPLTPGGFPQTQPATMPSGLTHSQLGMLGGLTGDRVQVQVLQDGNVMLIGDPRDVEIIQAFIAQLEGQPGIARSFRAFKLNNAQAATIAPQVAQFWNQAHQPIAGQVKPEYRVTIMPEPRANLLMVATSEQNMQELENIIQQLDQPALDEAGKKQLFQRLPLKHIKAIEAEAAVRDLLADLRTRRGSQTDPATIRADPRTNSLLISASQADFDQIRELVQTIDVEPTATGGGALKLALFPLRKAVATQLAQALNDMLEAPAQSGGTSSAQGAAMKEQIRRLQMINMRRPGGEPLAELDLEKPIRVWPEEGTNSLIVATIEPNLAPMNEIIQLLDSVPLADQILVRSFELKYAEAEALQTNLRNLFDQGAKLPEQPGRSQVVGEIPINPEGSALAYPVGISFDKRTNMLIVSGRQEQIQLIQDIVERVDVKGTRLAGPFQVLPLQNLTAADVSDKVTQLWQRRTQLRQQAGLPPDEPAVVADPRTNTLVISASAEDAEDIAALVKQLEAQKLSPMMEIRTITIRNNDPDRVGDAIETIFENRLQNSLGSGQKEQPGDRVAVVTDPLTRTLLIASNRANFEEVSALVAKLDVAPSLDSIMRTFLIRNADVNKVASIVTELFQGGIFQGTNVPSDLPESLRKVTVVADERSSTIIVSASPENLKLVEQLIERVDQADTPMFAGAQFFKIENADVVRVADMLDQLLQGIQSTIEDQSQMQFKVIPDPRARMLLVSGTRFALKQAETLIPRLDVQPGTPIGEPRVYLLKQATARQLEPILTDLFDRRQQGGATQAKSTPVLIQSVESSNSLIVTASPEEHAVVENLLQLLDKPSNLAQQMRIFPLEAARAEDLATTLTELIQQQQSGGGRGAAAAPPIAITPEPRTNSIVVFAPPDLMSNVEQILERLDTVKPKVNMSLNVFRLRNARAEDLAQRLQEFFQEASTGGGGGRSGGGRQMIIDFPSVNPDTGILEQRQLVYQDVTIMPDPATNSLTVLAPRGSIDMMRHLVEMLDNVELQTAKVRVFALRNADAERMRTTLEELFQGTGTAGGRGGGTSGQQQTRLVFGGADGAGAPTAAEGGGALELAFSVDQRTNSLIAAGSLANLAIVEDLVLELDYKPIDERIVRVVHLRNATAEDVSQTLQSYFDSESSKLQGASGDQEAAARRLEREVTVQSAGETQNTLLLSYSPRMESQIVNMIQELDLPPPQVMIQVLMAEVTLDDRLEMGMEFALQDLNFSERSFTRNGVLQGPNFDKVFGTDIGAQGQSGLGGISFTITGEDFNFLVRALQTDGRLEVLSRPSILVQDNQDANITVGSRVPTVQDITVSAAGVVTPSVSYEEVGIKLDVTPIINPDGFVNMKIRPEISSIGSSSVTVASGVTLPTFDTREAETSVTVKDGETIIIGGLITNRQNNTENKVPIAGDIPFLGNLFRASVKAQTKTELLMVLTPHVIRDAEQARRISIQMRDGTGIMKNVRRDPLMGGLQVKPEDEQFGPAGPVIVQPAGPPAEEYGPVPEEYGPPISAIQREEGRSAPAFGPARSLARTTGAQPGPAAGASRN